MSRFFRKNKKRIDPRYFLNETMDSFEDPDDDSDDAAELLDMMDVDKDELIAQIRQASKDLEGFRDAYGYPEDLGQKSIPELEDILYDQAHSPIQKDIDDRYRDEDEAALGYNHTVDPLENEPKFAGMGRPTVRESVEDVWPAEKTQDAMMGRAKDLAHQGMSRQMGGEIPPWEKKQYAAPTGDSVTDEDVIRAIFNLMSDNQSSDYRALAGRFMEMMKERGVVSQEAGDKIDKGYKVRSARNAGFAPGDDKKINQIYYGSDYHPNDPESGIS